MIKFEIKDAKTGKLKAIKRFCNYGRSGKFWDFMAKVEKKMKNLIQILKK